MALSSPVLTKENKVRMNLKHQDDANKDTVCERVSPCFTKDVGSQRCRVPGHVVPVLRAPLGSCFSVDLGSSSYLCTLSVWKDQKANRFQLDESVSLCRSETSAGAGGNSRLSKVPLSSFKRLNVVVLRKVKVTLVFNTYADVQHYKKRSTVLKPLLAELLSGFIVATKYVVACDSSAAAKLLKLHCVVVDDCFIASNDAGRVTAKTQVDVVKIQSRDFFEASSADERGEKNRIVLGGLEKPKRLLRELLYYPFRHGDLTCDMGISYPKGILLIGPPGTGKTSLVCCVARECGAALVHCAAPSFCKPRPGDGEILLRRTFQKACDLSEEGPCILFVDEIECLLLKKGSHGGGHQNDRLMAQMLSLMDSLETRGKVVIVGATNRPAVLDSSVRRPGRFDHEVYIGVPSLLERQKILEVVTSQLPMTDVNLRRIAEWTPGFVGADLVHLCQEIALSKMNAVLTGSGEQSSAVSEADFQKALMSIRPSTKRGTAVQSDFQPVHWNDIGGLESVKLRLKQAIEWPMKHRRTFQALGIPSPRGVLLCGPPGCCKTTLVRAVATACNMSFLSATAAHIYSPYVGDSEKAITELFRKCRMTPPTLLFLDEIDAIVGKRSPAESGRGGGRIHEKVLSILLNEMDGIGIKVDTQRSNGDQMMKEEDDKELEIESTENYVAAEDDADGVIVVAATNRIDLIDEALLRPGRFDKIIYVPPPDEKTRIEILQTHTRNMPVLDVDFVSIAHQTPYFSGADLENLCREAALHALSENGFEQSCSIRQAHFTEALQQAKPSLSEQQLHFYKSVQLQLNSPT